MPITADLGRARIRRARRSRIIASHPRQRMKDSRPFSEINVTVRDERAWAFGDYVLDVAERRLLRSGVELDLTPKAMDLLVALVERGGRLLSKAELMRRLWPDAVVEEGTLARHVSALRKALAMRKQASP